MSLQDEGFRLMCSSDGQSCRWVHWAEIPIYYPDWLDVTDWPEDRLIKLVTQEDGHEHP
jgi:hypothetical protein